MSVELWLPIPGYEGRYEASSEARVRSLVFTSQAGRVCVRADPIVLKTGYVTGGRRAVLLAGADRARRTKTVGRCVAEAFHGPCPDGCELSHLDGNHLNDLPSNLTWEPHATNCRRRIAHGTQPRGERHGRSKLTESQVEEIRACDGLSQSAIAERFGVSQSLVSLIRLGKKWKRSA